MNPANHDLPAALRRATTELVAEKGASGFSLREVARRAGVSHSAPKHHFGNSKGLLTSVAIEGFQFLKVSFERAESKATSPREHLTLLGQAYLSCALTHPGHFAIMMREDLTDHENEELIETSLDTFSLLVTMVESLRNEINPNLDVMRAALLCWSLLQGLVVIGPRVATLGDLGVVAAEPADSLIEHFSELMVEGFRSR